MTTPVQQITNDWHQLSQQYNDTYMMSNNLLHELTKQIQSQRQQLMDNNTNNVQADKNIQKQLATAKKSINASMKSVYDNTNTYISKFDSYRSQPTNDSTDTDQPFIIADTLFNHKGNKQVLDGKCVNDLIIDTFQRTGLFDTIDVFQQEINANSPNQYTVSTETDHAMKQRYDVTQQLKVHNTEPALHYMDELLHVIDNKLNEYDKTMDSTMNDRSESVEIDVEQNVRDDQIESVSDDGDDDDDSSMVISDHAVNYMMNNSTSHISNIASQSQIDTILHNLSLINGYTGNIVFDEYSEYRQLLLQYHEIRFVLHKLTYLQILYDYLRRDINNASIQSPVAQLLQYGKNHFSDYMTTHNNEIKQLTGCLMYINNIQASPYNNWFTSDQVDSTSKLQPLPIQWTQLIDRFCDITLRVLNKSYDCPLLVCLHASDLCTHKLLQQHELLATSGVDDVSKLKFSSSYVSLDITLPQYITYHSHFICPVTRECSSIDDCPQLLLCGHMISTVAMERMAAGLRQHRKFKCMTCPAEQSVQQCLPVIL